MALDDSAAISVTSLVFLGGVQLMQQLGPGIDEVRTAKPGDPKMRAQLNVAELTAGGTVLAAGATISALAGRWEPIAMALVVVIGSTAAYEMAWRASGTTHDPLTMEAMGGARGGRS